MSVYWEESVLFVGVCVLGLEKKKRKVSVCFVRLGESLYRERNGGRAFNTEVGQRAAAGHR